MSGQEKTEQPTPKRRQEAVDKGNLPKSNEVNSAAVMLAGLATFTVLQFDDFLVGSLEHQGQDSEER